MTKKIFDSFNKFVESLRGLSFLYTNKVALAWRESEPTFREAGRVAITLLIILNVVSAIGFYVDVKDSSKKETHALLAIDSRIPDTILKTFRPVINEAGAFFEVAEAKPVASNVLNAELVSLENTAAVENASPIYDVLLSKFQTTVKNLKNLITTSFEKNTSEGVGTIDSSIIPTSSLVQNEPGPEITSPRITQPVSAFQPTSINLSLRSQIDQYVREQFAAQQQILFANVRASISRQSDSDSDRRSVTINNITESGDFTSPTISGGTITSAAATLSSLSGASLSTCQSNNVLTWAGGQFGCEADDTGSGAAFAWTPTAYGVSTSTTLGFLNGFLSTASSTFTSGFNFTTATATSATTTNLFSTVASSTNLSFTNLNFDGVNGNSWDDFCTRITGSAGLCDGSDATGGSGDSKWATTTSPYLSLSPNGGTNINLGVGTTTGIYTLTAASSSGPQLALSSGAGFVQWAFRNAGGLFYLATTTTAGTATSTTAALTINTNGFLGIGSTTPSQTLSVTGNAFISGNATSTNFFTTTASSTNLFAGGTVTFAGLAATTTPGSSICFGNASGARGNLTQTNGTTACGSLSSRQFKFDINSLNKESGLAEVMALRPVSYKYTPEFLGGYSNNRNWNGTFVGFIAEEVAEVDERLIERDEEGKPRAVQYDKITSILARATQELTTTLGIEATSTEEEYESVALSSYFQKIWRALGDKLNDAGSALDRIMARRLEATETICINDTCINEAQLVALLSQCSIGNNFVTSIPIVPVTEIPAPTEEIPPVSEIVEPVESVPEAPEAPVNPEPVEEPPSVESEPTQVTL